MPLLDENGKTIPAAVDGNGNPVALYRDDNDKSVPPLVDKHGNPVGSTHDESG